MKNQKNNIKVNIGNIQKMKKSSNIKVNPDYLKNLENNNNTKNRKIEIYIYINILLKFAI